MPEEKAPPKPAAWKNTYFWIAAILLIVGVIGFLKGEMVIRDPGQKTEGYLSLIYLGGFVVMWLNGVISHRQTEAHYAEYQEQLESEARRKKLLADGLNTPEGSDLKNES